MLARTKCSDVEGWRKKHHNIDKRREMKYEGWIEKQKMDKKTKHGYCGVDCKQGHSLIVLEYPQRNSAIK